MSEGRADLVFVGGRVLVAPAPRPLPAAIAVSAGRITAVTSDDRIGDLVGRGTEVVEIGDGLLAPAFQDAHVHPVMAGLDMLVCDLHATRTADDALATIARYAAAHPDVPWITGGGWSMDHFPGGTPTREALDAIVADRPAFLANRDGHGAWVNSEALRRAGIDATTPDPADGRIERGPDGTPSGTLHEGAMSVFDRLLPPISQADAEQGLRLAQAHLFALGIAGWQDALVDRDIYAAYLAAARDGWLKARVVGALWWERDQGAEQLPELLERRDAAAGAGRFRATSVKIMQDGVAENFTAGMTEAYLDADGHVSANSGLSFVDPRALCEHVSALDAAGFQVHFHTLGDRAVREALDALAAARAANGPSDHRHHLAHLQVIHPDDIPRFAELGAVANIQPLWAAHEPQMDELTIPFLGERRSAWQYPFGSLAGAAARLAAGSDWSVSSPDPLQGIHVAVNRVAPDTPGMPSFYPENAISLEMAFAAYTSGAVYVNHLEQQTGTIAAGKLADLVLLRRDPFAGPPAEIADNAVLRTYVEGELVYGA